MENFSQLVPIVVFAPLIGLLINLILGRYLGERGVGMVAIGAALTAFFVAVLLFLSLANTHYAPTVVELPFLRDWFNIPAAAVDIGWQFRVDTLSVTMMLVVSGVGSLIHFYATGYMHGDAMYPRFFVYLNLFLVFMMLLVTGNNFLVLFIGWEGVGLCSYLLISFWWDKTQKDSEFGTVGWKNSIAGRKAFIVNRVGDFGLLIGMFLVFWTFGTLDYYKPGNTPIAAHHEEAAAIEVIVVEGGAEVTVEDANAEAADAHAAETDEHGAAAAHDAGMPEIDPDVPLSAQLGVFNQVELMMAEGHDVDFGPFSLSIEAVVTLITLFFLLGVTGKSAQIPLFVWLPDAMAGPTPVSALIHAATMVTAGVYLIVRCNVLYHYAPATSAVVALVGTATALAGGFVALGQWDIKKVLAYSTVSQLGFMVAAAGIGAYAAAMFHLATHAVFKALLFLGSGVIIHAVEHGHHHAAEHADGDDHGEHEDHVFDPQDMRNMGGLREKMPRTFYAYLIGALALAGIFPLAGFWSKDEILADAISIGFLDGEFIGYITFGGLLIAAALTAFYMGRQLVIVFLGKPRTAAAEHANETDFGMKVMVNVLIVLAIVAIFIGLINIPSGFWIFDRIFPNHLFTDWLANTVPYAHAAPAQMLLAISAVALGLAMLGLAYRIYNNNPVADGGKDMLELNPQTSGVFKLSNARLYWDETYDRFIVQPFNRLGRWFAEKLDWAFLHDFVHETVLKNAYNALARLWANPIDQGLIDGLVNLVGRLMNAVGGWLRPLQTGYVRVYALSIFFGAVAVIVIMLLPFLRQSMGW